MNYDRSLEHFHPETAEWKEEKHRKAASNLFFIISY